MDQHNRLIGIFIYGAVSIITTQRFLPSRSIEEKKLSLVLSLEVHTCLQTHNIMHQS